MNRDFKTDKTLVFIPTYNERENAQEMFAQLKALNIDNEILFVDDKSPDGTGDLLNELAKEHHNLHVIHRSGKLGIGSAHIDGIKWAYEHEFTRLITMDCDFTHSPSDIYRLLEHSSKHDVVVGSRYLQRGSLPGWNLLRRFLTNFGHLMTKMLLKMPFDATGAFRVYDLTKIPLHVFSNVQSRGYSFFFESLFLLLRNGFSVFEVAIMLPARTYGHSKMSMREASRSGLRILKLYFATLINPEQFHVVEPFTEINPSLADPQHWEDYWEKKEKVTSFLYDLIATIYRNLIIKRRLNRFIRKHFTSGAHLLHAGCGSGQVDSDIQKEMDITAVDISVPALHLYKKNNPRARSIKHASILDLPFSCRCFDGAYNLGVVEHFSEGQIRKILLELHRVLKEEGKVIIFWPHARASSVLFLRLVHWLLNRVMRKNVQLHPPEISLLKSRRMVEPLFREVGFNLIDYYFGMKDLFVQTVIVLQKRELAIS